MEVEFKPLSKYKNMSFGAEAPTKLEWQQHLTVCEANRHFKNPKKAWLWLLMMEQHYHTLEGLEYMREFLKEWK